MGTWDEFEDDETGEQQNGPKALREAQKAAAKRAAELEEQNAKLAAQLARFTLRDVLEQKGLSPKLAKWMVKDGVDGSDETAVSTWLTENAEDFGISTPSAEEQGSQDEGAAELAAIRAAEQGALPPDNKYDDVIRRIQESDGSPAAINAITQGLR